MPNMNAVDQGTSVYAWRSAGKKTGPLESRLSKQLEIIGTDTDRLGTYDCLLMLGSHELFLYRFQDIARY